MVSGSSGAECRKDEFSFMSVLTFGVSLESGSKKRQCKVLFEYIPQNEDELELKVGDVIDIIDEVRAGHSCAESQTTFLADYLHYKYVRKTAWEVVFLQLKLIV